MTKTLRQRHIVGSDGKTLIVALDRSRALLTRSLSEPARVLQQCRAAKVDAVLVPLGTLLNCLHEFGALGVIYSVREGIDPDKVVDTALRHGVDGVKFEAFPGGPAELATMSTLESLGRACEAAGLPLLAEMIPHSFEATELHTADAVSAAARMAMECGADMAKVPTPIDGGFSSVIADAGIPVVALGGPVKSNEVLLESARSAISAGAAGLAVGRNVFESTNPRATAAALCEVIHRQMVTNSSHE